jgi:hypothetical protein
MTKLLKHSVLALVLAIGSGTYAHAETVTAYGGIGGIVQDFIEWLFGSSGNHNQGNQNPNVAPEVDPGLAMSGFMLLGGTLTVLRSRRSRRPAIN